MNCVVITVSDGVHQGTREDASGAVLARLAAEQGLVVTARHIVPDDSVAIGRLVRDVCDDTDAAVALVLVTGGTGFAPRDVTPEALAAVYERPAPGIDEAVRAASMRQTAHGVLSRACSGLRGRTLIVSLPGSPRACEEGFAVIAPVLDHALALATGAASRHP